MNQILLHPTARVASPGATLGTYGAELMRALDRAATADDLAGTLEAWTVVKDLLAEGEPEDRDAVVALVRGHPAAGVAWQDPITRRLFDRPRGHPGDAALLDLLYGHPAAGPLLRAATPAGRRVTAFSHGLETAVAVRERRHLLAALIDEAVDRVGAPDILAVAGGHLREIEAAPRAREVRRLVALDGDEEGLAEVRRAYGDLPIECARVPLGRLPARLPVRRRFDLIYAADLYDRLDDRAAARLTGALFRILKPGGRLLFANFAAGLRDAAYLDALGDWRPVLRDEDAMWAFLDALPEEAVAATRLFRGGNRAIIYAVAARR